MDPSANLAEQRQITAKIMAAVDAADPDTGAFTVDPDDAYRLAELVQSLDEWLSRGGFLPGAWSPATRPATAF